MILISRNRKFRFTCLTKCVNDLAVRSYKMHDMFISLDSICHFFSKQNMHIAKFCFFHFFGSLSEYNLNTNYLLLALLG